MWSNFQLLDIQGAKRQFPSDKSLLVLIFSSSASIKAIIMPHATESTSTPRERGCRDRSPRHDTHLPPKNRNLPSHARNDSLVCVALVEQGATRGWLVAYVVVRLQTVVNSDQITGHFHTQERDAAATISTSPFCFLLVFPLLGVSHFIMV